MKTSNIEQQCILMIKVLLHLMIICVQFRESLNHAHLLHLGLTAVHKLCMSISYVIMKFTILNPLNYSRFDPHFG